MAYEEAGDASVLSLGAELSVDVELLGLSIGVRDSVEVELPGAVVLLLLPQAAAVRAASPSRSARSVFRMGDLNSYRYQGWTDLGWSAGPRRLGSAAPLRPVQP